ncbi:hypothetical protein CBS101457_001908 [Exobasidium rhododendri]|nr:hypothetical protein CBS101457_001908 [Exobasidium rhododendri]
MSGSRGWNGQDVANDTLFRPYQTPGASRMSTFSPFRKGSLQTHPNVNEGDIFPFPGEGPTLYKGGLGQVSDVPSVSRAPVKPPKPAGLRVKKARALSISLLTGGGSNGSNSQDLPHPGESVAERRQSRVLPSNQHYDVVENFETSPAHLQSAVDHYNKHGPTKGLASRDWVGMEGTYKRRGSDRNEGRERDESDQLFIIGKEAIAVQQQSSIESARRPSRDTEENSRTAMPHFKGGLRELRAHQEDVDAKSREVQDRADSSVRMLHPSSSSVTTAHPFLNTYPARAQLGSAESSNHANGHARKRSMPTLLGSPDTISSSNLTYPDTDFNANASEPTASSKSQSQAQRLIHTPQLMYEARARKQHHTEGSATQSAKEKKTTTTASYDSDRSTSHLPPPRHKHSQNHSSEGFLRLPGNRKDDDSSNGSFQARSSSPLGQAASIQAIGHHLGGMGVAVGKKGWDMMKSWKDGTSQQNNTLPTPYSMPSSSTLNEATRTWLQFPDPTASTSATRASGATNPSGVTLFGSPLREAVIKTRLARKGGRKMSGAKAQQLSALDLGSEFSITLPNLNGEIDCESLERKVLPRLEARRQYLPAIVVRCIESIEKWGVQEEGIYRLSGRSSHTAKLKVIFESTRPAVDLKLQDIGPAELDLNSVCSVLKAYLRALPDLLLTNSLAKEFNQSVQHVCGMSAVSDVSNINHNRERLLREQHEKESGTRPSSPSSPGVLSQKIANAILPLMSKLPAVNWYLLREIAFHLGDLTKEDVVRETKMPLSNLCLILAPTLSLSVAMVRVLVESREQLFEGSLPLPDAELDSSSPQPGAPTRAEAPIGTTGEQIRPPLPLRNYRKNVVNNYDLPGPRQGTRNEHDWEGKRASVATVTPTIDSNNRLSNSSMTTLQQEGGRLAPTIVNPMWGAALHVTAPSDYSSSDGMSFAKHMDGANDDGDDDDDDDNKMYNYTPPIAARYLQKRSSSLISSTGSNPSSTSISNPQISKTPSSTSLHSTALQSSTMSSSTHSLPDRDSPRTLEDSWPASTSNKQDPSGSSYNSGGSSTSLHKMTTATGGALDRPRPMTSDSARFFSGQRGSKNIVNAAATR